MANTFKWTAPEAIVSYFTTGLNSLADAAFVDVWILSTLDATIRI